MLDRNFLGGRVKLIIWAKRINSLHEDDFVLATKADEPMLAKENRRI